MHLIDDFVRLSENTPACALFRKWAAIFGVAVMTRRRVWLVMPGFDEDMPLYPNFYILLVAPPGRGKTVTAKRVQKLLNRFPEVRFTADDTTAPRLIQDLADATRKDAPDWLGGKLVAVTHRAAILSEFANFLPRDDADFMASLSALWDNEEVFLKETKTAGIDRLENIFLNLIGGVQPAWFSEDLPRGAFDQGLFARIILVYSDYVKPLVVTGIARPDPARWEPWLADMERVLHLKGQFVVPETVHERMQTWIDKGQTPVPTHPLLANYSARRHMHVYKLAMISALAARRELKLEPCDIDWAIETLLEAEQYMAKALAVAGQNPNRLYEEQAVTAVLAGWTPQSSKPTSETRVRAMLMQNMPAHLIDASIENLIGSGRLSVTAGEKPNRMLKPGPYARQQ